MPKRILFAVLDWGLGHAARSAEVARSFEAQGAEVVFCSAGRAGVFLQSAFPENELLPLPSAPVRYGARGAVPALIRRALIQPGQNKKEQRYIARLCAENAFDAVVSDNVYGAFSDRVPSVLITHQLSLPAPFLGSLVNRKTARWLENFTEVWIPDAPEGISGKLGTNRCFKGSTFHLGTLSRLRSAGIAPEKVYTCAAILSGPEPLRSIFEREVLRALTTLPGKKILVRGVPDTPPLSTREDMLCINFADGAELTAIIEASEYVLCRAGFSTLSDLIRLRAKALIIPTPGQFEQAYLARRMAGLGQFAAHKTLPRVLPKGTDIPTPQPELPNRTDETVSRFLATL